MSRERSSRRVSCRAVASEAARRSSNENEKEIILEHEDDPLAKAAQLDNALPLRGADRHIDRAQEEWAREPHLLQRLVRDAGTKMLDVKRDVWKFGQECVSYLGVPVRQSPSSIARTNGDPPSGLAGKRPAGRGPIYPRSPR